LELIVNYSDRGTPRKLDIHNSGVDIGNKRAKTISCSSRWWSCAPVCSAMVVNLSSHEPSFEKKRRFLCFKGHPILYCSTQMAREQTNLWWSQLSNESCSKCVTRYWRV